jgi:hypothetical protein
MMAPGRWLSRVLGPFLGVIACSHSYTELDQCPHAGATAYPRAETGEPCYAAPSGVCEKWTKCTMCIVGAVCSNGASAGSHPDAQCTCGGSGTWSCDPGPGDASGCVSIADGGLAEALAPPGPPCGQGFVCPEAGTDIDCQPVVPAANAVLCTLACQDLVQSTCPGVGFSY